MKVTGQHVSWLGEFSDLASISILHVSYTFHNFKNSFRACSLALPHTTAYLTVWYHSALNIWSYLNSYISLIEKRPVCGGIAVHDPNEAEWSGYWCRVYLNRAHLWNRSPALDSTKVVRSRISSLGRLASLGTPNYSKSFKDSRGNEGDAHPREVLSCGYALIEYHIHSHTIMNLEVNWQD